MTLKVFLFIQPFSLCVKGFFIGEIPPATVVDLYISQACRNSIRRAPLEVIKMEALKHRVIAMLDRQELEFLDKIGKDALFSTGHKLSYNQILRGLVDFIREIGISGDKMSSGEDLKEKILQRFYAKAAGIKEGN